MSLDVSICLTMLTQMSVTVQSTLFYNLNLQLVNLIFIRSILIKLTKLTVINNNNICTQQNYNKFKGNTDFLAVNILL